MRVEDLSPGDWFAVEDHEIGRVFQVLAMPVPVGRRGHRKSPVNAFGYATDGRVLRTSVWSNRACRRLDEAEVVEALRVLRERMVDPVAVEREVFA